MSAEVEKTEPAALEGYFYPAQIAVVSSLPRSEAKPLSPSDVLGIHSAT